MSPDCHTETFLAYRESLQGQDRVTRFGVSISKERLGSSICGSHVTVLKYCDVPLTGQKADIVIATRATYWLTMDSASACERQSCQSESRLGVARAAAQATTANEVRRDAIFIVAENYGPTRASWIQVVNQA